MAEASAAADHLPSVLRWSIADAWGWFGHAWRTFIHLPFLGVVALAVALVLLLRAVGKILR